MIVVPPDRLFIARWNLEIQSGRGLGPLSTARTLRTLLQRLETSLSTEAGAKVGYLLPVPSDGQSVNVQKLREDIEALAGRIAIIETTAGGWGEGVGQPRQEFRLARMGPEFPDPNVRLYIAAQESVLAACGYPVQLVQSADGTAQREAWRRYLHGTVAPMGRIVTAAARKAGLAIDIGWDQLFASDVQGRARAFQSLVQGGMSLEAAAAASGILTPQED